MYLPFYQLKHKPFQISTDPRFLWLGDKHEEALATLRYGILDNKGFLLLTGDVGTGKTTLINALLRTLQQNTLVASIRDPALDLIDFFNYTAHVFGMEGNFTSKGSFLVQFERFLLKANSENKKVLLIIDEAQRISQELLEEVRLLSNIEREDSKLLNIFFVGQIEFNEIILRPENRPIRQRITVNYNIPPLTRQETGEYIQHRLKIAGAGVKIFEEEALGEIFSFSKGYPRLINIICDRALLTGFVEESKTITIKHVKECAAELEIPQIRIKESLNQEVEKKQQEKKTEFIPKSVPTHHLEKEQNNTNDKHVIRNTILTITVLIFLSLVYFSFSENGIQPLLRHSMREFLQDFWQKTDKAVEAKRPDSNRITINSQLELQPEKRDNLPLHEDTIAYKSTHENVERLFEDTSVDKMNISLAVQTDPQKQTDITDLSNKTTINIGNLKDETGNKKLKNSENAVTTLNANNSQPSKNRVNEQEFTANQDNQIKFLENFKKLVITFPTNSNYPPFESLEELNMLVEAVLPETQYTVFVTGFSDSFGSESYNVKLSEFRANSVKSYLMGKGLKESRIETEGLGSQHPVAPNDSLSGRKANRRVEITVHQ